MDRRGSARYGERRSAGKSGRRWCSCCPTPGSCLDRSDPHRPCGDADRGAHAALDREGRPLWPVVGGWADGPICSPSAPTSRWSVCCGCRSNSAVRGGPDPGLRRRRHHRRHGRLADARGLSGRWLVGRYLYRGGIPDRLRARRMNRPAAHDHDATTRATGPRRTTDPLHRSRPSPAHRRAPPAAPPGPAAPDRATH